MRVPLIQWTIQLDENQNVVELADSNHPTTESQFTNTYCEHCKSNLKGSSEDVDPSFNNETGFCWHKLWSHGYLKILQNVSTFS